MYKIELSTQAAKDAAAINRTVYKNKVSEIIKAVRQNPYDAAHKFEKLHGDLKGAYSRRIDKVNRVVYHILPNAENLKGPNGELYEGIVSIVSMLGHYS